MAENESIKFYILIPTRERPATLLHCLHTIIHQSYTNFEIIVSDNFSQDNTENIVASISDPRISYINTEKRVGMASNFEYALSHTKSGWVTILGDDDGLLPEGTGASCKYNQDNWHGNAIIYLCRIIPGLTVQELTLYLQFRYAKDGSSEFQKYGCQNS